MSSTKFLALIATALISVSSVRARAENLVPVERLPMSALAHSSVSEILAAQLRAGFADGETRQIQFDEIRDAAGRPDRLIVRIFSNKYHKFETVRVNLDSSGGFKDVIRNYTTTNEDRSQKDAFDTPHCPDNSVEFIAFAPNTDTTEQSVTVGVAQAAEAKGLKTVRLLLQDATRANYLNYMSCPNLKGNFYDGDANPTEIVTVDGVLTSIDFQNNLRGAFRHRVTNIWLACEAYNNPMLGVITDDDQTQKYAAGINDLLIGPSDNAGACAMKAAIAGQPMTAAFNACYKQYDNTQDQWGFGGNGSDLFGQ